MHCVMGNRRVFEQSLDIEIHGQQILQEGHGNRSNHHLVREYAEFVQDELGDLKKAEETYEQALQECPVDVDWWEALIAFRGGRRKENSYIFGQDFARILFE